MIYNHHVLFVNPFSISTSTFPGQCAIDTVLDLAFCTAGCALTSLYHHHGVAKECKQLSHSNPHCLSVFAIPSVKDNISLLATSWQCVNFLGGTWKFSDALPRASTPTPEPLAHVFRNALLSHLAGGGWSCSADSPTPNGQLQRPGGPPIRYAHTYICMRICMYVCM